MKRYVAFFIFCLSIFSFLQSNAQKQKIPALGVCTSYENDSVLKAAGFVYLEEGARKLFAPSVSDSAFRGYVARIRRMKLKLETCNLFLPRTMRVTGPEADEKAILGYVDTLMQRAKIAGVKIIIFGSADSRKLIAGQDPKKAMQELIAISRKMAEVAKKYDRIIAMENLNTTEDNFTNTLEIATGIAKAVDHPNFLTTADLYHMQKDGEDPNHILAAGPYLVHCHIAEKEGRRAPGTSREDFRPYFAAMKKVHYKGRIMFECGWKNMGEEARPAYNYLLGQLEEIYR